MPLLFLVGLLLVPCLGTAQQDRDLTIEDMRVEQRVALVIGNSAYANSPLRNPINDAVAMTGALEQVGFEVIQALDANQLQMRRAIRDFGRKIQSGGGVGLFFYAGHGMQVNGRNFLIPVGTEIHAEDEVAFQAVDANEVLAKMESASNRLNLVVLDACRNNPFARSFRSNSRGLAKMDEPTGTFLAYATAPGDVAADGDNDNSPFTTAFIRHMSTPGLKIEEMYKNVRTEVYNQTLKKQTPWNSSSLIGDFYFQLEKLNKAPLADAGSNKKVQLDATVQLDGSLSLDADGDALRFSWRQLEGPTVQLLASDSATPSFVPADQGNYRFGLVVSDGRTESPLDEVVIQVQRRNGVPIAHSGGDRIVERGQTVTLDGQNSQDPEDDELIYQWVQLEGPQVALSESDSATPHFIADQEGIYRFQLVVNDGSTASAPVEVTIQSVKKSGSKKWVWWVLGVGAVGATGAVVASGGGGSKTTPPTGSLEFGIPLP
jgi:hypothetical protein